MPLPVSTTWYLVVNGYTDRLPLVLISVDAGGNVTGTLSTSGNQDGGIPLHDGRWQEDARELSFKVTLENGEIQTYTGFLFDQAPDGVQTSYLGAPQYGLAGTFVGDRFEDPRRPGFGWFALGSNIIT
ncbi:MAG: hypothetical protein ACREP9_22305 [Candidatus Dormibacteraceae bacterium]